MKKTILTLLSVLFCAITFAQNVPQGINYQALARDAAGAELANDTLAVQFSIITSGSVSWQETHTVTTNDFGLFTAIIGNGTTTNGGSSSTFDLVDWGAAAHSLKVEIDYGNGYLDMGTTDFMSVPYSLHAKTAANGSTTDELQTLSISGDTISISNGNFVVLDIECFVAGCTDSNACNYNSSACYNNGSCISALYGCTDSTALNYDVNATCDDGSCIVVVLGCTDSTAYSGYNPLANTDDGSCIAVVNGCTDSTAFNYNSLANTDDGSCIACINGCTDTTASNYDSLATCDDGSCTYNVLGCTDSTAFNYNSLANTDDGSCIAVALGCTDSTAFNYNLLANTDDGSCIYPLAIGDTHQGGIIFWLDGNGGGLIAAPSDQSDAQWGCHGTLIAGADGFLIGTGAQNTIDIEAGCTTPGTAADICANYTDGTYSDWFLPSRDELNEMYLNIGQGNALGLGNIGGFATNYYWSSTEFVFNKSWYQDFSNGYLFTNFKLYNYSVRAVRSFTIANGCTDPTACNYDTTAIVDDGSCGYISGCTDSTSSNYDASATCDDGSCIACINGCTDTTASNYDSLATCDDGSCTYNVLGCTDSTAYSGYNPLANTDDGSCIAVVNGCTDSTAYSGYNPLANTDDGSCIAVVSGCTDSTAFNYNALANTDDGFCASAIGDNYQGGIIFYLDGNGGGLIAAPTSQSYGTEWGCFGTDLLGAAGTAIGAGTQNTVDIELGCTTPNTAADICANLTLGGYSDWFLPSKDELNEMYLNKATIGGFTNVRYWSSFENGPGGANNQHFGSGNQNGSAKTNTFHVRAIRAFGSITLWGCMDSTMWNYSPNANVDDGNCIIEVNGCTDTTALNYDPLANTGDGSCIAVVNGCTDTTAFNYNPLANTDDGSCIAVVLGCTDSTAYSGYNPLANTDDGSCMYPLAIGDTYQGGIIFWLDGNGGGLIAAPSDQSSGAQWGCYGTFIGTETAFGTGAQNTIDILGGCSQSGTAADICSNLNLGGYSDWFFPSKDELTEMYLNIGQGSSLGNVGGFADDFYLSSSENGNNYAWGYQFQYGLQVNYPKSTNMNVRAVRAIDNNVYGCTDSLAINYNPLSYVDDSSCCFNGDLCIGSTYQGGIIFWLNGNGGGLIAAPSDQSSGAQWGCPGTSGIGATGITIGEGAQNTNQILTFCSSCFFCSPIAAELCADLTLGGYSDWFLPSKDELTEMYLNIGQGSSLGNVGGFANNYYWSSTAYLSESWQQSFNNGTRSLTNRGNNNGVRAVRAF
jgi:hypothetical protein